jgi:hypothetical protein
MSSRALIKTAGVVPVSLKAGCFSRLIHAITLLCQLPSRCPIKRRSRANRSFPEWVNASGSDRLPVSGRAQRTGSSVCSDTHPALGLLRVPFLSNEQHHGLAFKSQFSHPPSVALYPLALAQYAVLHIYGSQLRAQYGEHACVHHAVPLRAYPALQCVCGQNGKSRARQCSLLSASLRRSRKFDEDRLVI